MFQQLLHRKLSIAHTKASLVRREITRNSTSSGYRQHRKRHTAAPIRRVCQRQSSRHRTVHLSAPYGEPRSAAPSGWRNRQCPGTKQMRTCLSVAHARRRKNALCKTSKLYARSCNSRSTGKSCLRTAWSWKWKPRVPITTAPMMSRAYAPLPSNGA